MYMSYVGTPSDTGSMVLRSRTLLLSGVLAALLAAAFGVSAFAKGEELTLSVRIVGAAGERDIKFVSDEDLARAAPFSEQIADLEQMATPLVFGSDRPVGQPTPGLTEFYEIDFTQTLATYRFPWNGMSSPRFYFYPAHGNPAYVRLHVARGSQPAVDGWVLARPAFTDLIMPHLVGLTPIHSQMAKSAQPFGFWWLGPILLLAAASALLVRRVGRYFIPLVAAPPTK
jgi:hypothetical protein